MGRFGHYHESTPQRPNSSSHSRHYHGGYISSDYSDTSTSPERQSHHRHKRPFTLKTSTGSPSLKFTIRDTSDKVKSPPIDPRLPQDHYLSTCKQASSFKLEGCNFLWDQHSRESPPPTTLLVTMIPANITSRSLLKSVIQTAIEIDSSSFEVLAIRLNNETDDKSFSFATLSASSPETSSFIMNKIYTRRHQLGWSIQYDENGHKFRKLIEFAEERKKKQIEESKHSSPSQTPPRSLKDSRYSNIEVKRSSSESQSRDRSMLLKCSSRVDCLLISFELIPSSTSTLALEEIFRKCKLYNIEKDPHQWHIHLKNMDEIDYVIRRKDTFKFNNNILPLKFKKFHYPPVKLVETTVKTTNINEDTLESLYRAKEDSTLKLTSTSHQVPIDKIDIMKLPSFTKKRPFENEGNEEDNEDKETSVMQEETSVVEEEDTSFMEEGDSSADSFVSVVDEKEEKEDIKTPFKVLNLSDSNTNADDCFSRLFSLERVRKWCGEEGGERRNVFVEDLTMTSSQPTLHDQITPQIQNSNRSSRAQNRRLQAALEVFISSTLIDKGSQFQIRNKKVRVARSSIHSWGLFADEDIETGGMVVEYVGEMIRESVANARELKYELMVKAKGGHDDMISSYFFRLSEDFILDATHHGNESRFINHSCDPSCIARVVTVADKRHIIMYAKRDIQRGEEITYDYKFAPEENSSKKIACLCGAKNCRRYLN